MSSRTFVCVSRIVPLWGVFAAASFLGAALPVRGEDNAGVGKLESPTGTLLRREGAGKEWKVIANGDAVPDRDLLLALPGAHAAIKSGNGGVRLTLAGNLPQLSQTPALESAVSLRRSSDLDLDLILDRGRMLLTNTKQKGAANVRIRAREEIWDLTLKEPGAEVAVELNSRWPQGIPFRAAYRPGEEPRFETVLLVLKGAIDLKVDAQRHTLSAPPGPALFAHDSILGSARTPSPLADLPPWALPGAEKAEPVVAVRTALKSLYPRLAKGPVDGALAELLASANKESDKKRAALDRELAVKGFGAIDDLPHLVDALNDAKHPEVRALAVATLRHWIGRAPGQDSQLAKYLRSKDMSPGHTTIILQLLHDFGEKNREDPPTYELLIAYLRNDKLAIRELAAWHLYRMVPAGETIVYDPAGSPKDREKAHDAWKKLIPDGKLPPESKK